MKNIGLIMEYEDILLGKRNEFSTSYLSKDNAENDGMIILKYVFENLLGWSPVTIRDFISPELIRMLHLQRVVNKIEFPPELDKNKDLFYLAWLMYPETVHHTRRDLTLKIYQQVLRGELTKFPKNFFLTARGEMNASICLQYAINQNLCVKTIEELYMMFSDKKRAREFLGKVRLLVPCGDIYEYPIDMLHDSLPTSQKNEFFYMYGKFLSVLKDTKGEYKRENKNQ